MRFSERKGIKPIRSIAQVDSIDEELRNSLWNTLCINCWEKIETYSNKHIYSEFEVFRLKNMWHNYFKWPVDTLGTYYPAIYKVIREYFYNAKWFEVYDFIEYVVQNYFYSDEELNKFTDICNAILERELSAYRFVSGKITQITAKEEIKEIEEALKAKNSLQPVNTHLSSALDKYSDRKSPDYRNSIKESISAVEAICNLITKDKKTTLGQALKEIENKIELHPALKNAFNSLYGYTSDANGIRHALLDEPNLNVEDAKFILVACSAFINYLKSKSSKAGIKL